jgi:hypothetical protein
MLKPLLIFICLLLITSCGLSARVEPFMDAQGSLGQNESVVILGRKHQATYQTESTLISCVASNLSSGSNSIPIYPTRSFEDLLFPWFEPSLAPLTTDDFALLLENDLVFNSINTSGVRYIVWLDGSTDRNDSGGTISCSAGPGGAGCIGLAWWEDGSRYDATIWDINTVDTAGTIYVDYTGRSMVPALIIPIPLIIRTQNAACTGISDQLTSFFSQNY